MPSLIQFLRSHDCTVAAWFSSGALHVASEVVDRSGRVWIRREKISPTLSACRDWLGY